MRKLNIDVDIVERYACGHSSSERKRKMTILSFAIWCKMQHSNSVIFSLTIREMKQKLGIGQAKVKMLLKAIEEDELFETIPNNRFKVKTFKDKTIKCDKKGREYKGCHVFTLDVKRSYKLKDIYDRLNELLFLRQIGSKEANDCNKGWKPNGRCRYSYITMKQLQGAVGMSHGSCCGIKKRLMQKKQITSTFAELHMADDRCEGEVERLLRKYGRMYPTFKQGHYVYVCIPCIYVIISRKAKESCGRHKIYDYDSKRTAGKKNMAGVYTSKGGAFLPLDGRFD